MQRCVATKDGGRYVDLTPEEEQAVLQEQQQAHIDLEREAQRKAIEERIPKAQDLAMLTAKAEFAPAEVDRLEARRLLQEALQAQRELEALGE